MYAVLSSGGKQYRVEPGSTLMMERLPSASPVLRSCSIASCSSAMAMT